MRFPLILFVLLFCSQLLSAQAPGPTAAEQRLAAAALHDSMQTVSPLKNIPFTSIGPSVMSGRVVDIEGDPEDALHFYVAYASGGLWESVDGGISFRPLFDNQPVMTIGDIAVDWQNKVLWVGTGENNSSRSSYSGCGIFRSTDNGKNWQLMGLKESHHIGRILINPQDTEEIWVAALGHLYSENEQRGVYKSTDGGTSWQKVLFVNSHTGAIDLEMDPTNPAVLYAATWERGRRAWNFNGNGAGSGIYKTNDSGASWKKLSGTKSGFPADSGVGRIGLAISPSQPQILYALLDNQNHRPKEEETGLTKEQLRNMPADKFLGLDEGLVNDFLDRYDFPMRFHADTLFQLMRAKKISPQTLVDFLEDANAQLFDTPVIGAELYRSEDGGNSWKRTHDDFLDNMFYTFGYYFGNVRVDPKNADKLYLLGVPILVSEDGGAHFKSLNEGNVHVDHHALWINPQNPLQMINGNDGGLNLTADGGKTWHKANPIPVGQFYTVAVDMAKPFNIYGGLQDNGVWYASSKHRENRNWQGSGHNGFKSIMGGDGMQVAIDTRDNNTVYTGFQFGNYYRIDRQSGKSTYITPQHKLGERPLRFNWQTPIHLSVHNQDILYMGSQKLHRSLNQGKDWETLSADLTLGGKKGNVPFGTLTTIHESPLVFGLIYTGSDDGLVHVTRDGGHSWQNISAGLPAGYWVSRVQASAFDTARVYVSLNGYRDDNCDALLFVSDDYGAHWRRLGETLPREPVNVFKEDPVNRDLLYVGTDHGLYASLDGGKSFAAFAAGLTGAPVHDLVVQPRDGILVVGTHGRSLFTADVRPLQQLTGRVAAEELHLFKADKINHSLRWGQRNYSWNFVQAPERSVAFYCRAGGTVKAKFKSPEGKTLWEQNIEADGGMNYLPLKFTVSEKQYRILYKKTDKLLRPRKIEAADDGNFYLLPGTYTLELRKGREKYSVDIELKGHKREARKTKKKTP